MIRIVIIRIGLVPNKPGGGGGVSSLSQTDDDNIFIRPRSDNWLALSIAQT